MGRQVCFFVTKKDLQNLIDLVNANGGIMLNSRNEIQDTLTNGQVFIRLNNSNLYYWDDYKLYEYSAGHIINQQASDIISFSDCRLIDEQSKNICRYEHGRFWYAPSYYDNNEQLVRKTKDLEKFFNKLKRYIVKHFIISVDKSWYIGPDAYIEYKKGFFVPCSGNYQIKFPE